MSNASQRSFVEHRVTGPGGALHVTDYPGDGAPIVMTHGFPDDSRIYDRLIPELSGRRVVTFDFLGHGRSERISGQTVQPGQREAELAAVLEALALTRVVLVGHDSGGPVVINYALAHPATVDKLVLLNTYFGDADALRFPEFIRLMADPNFTPLADAVLADPRQRGWVLAHTGRRFNQDPEDPTGVAPHAVAPQFFGDEDQPDAITAVRAWTAELFSDLTIQNEHVTAGDLAAAPFAVTLAFGVRDPYLNTDVARTIASHFTHASIHDVDDASHWPQWDQPAVTADIIATTAATNTGRTASDA